VHQTRDMINVYHVLIISYLYPVLYHIMSLSYHDHQTDPKKKQRVLINYEHSRENDKSQPIMNTQDFGSQSILGTTTTMNLCV